MKSFTVLILILAALIATPLSAKEATQAAVQEKAAAVVKAPEVGKEKAIPARQLVRQSIQKFKLAEGVSIDDAIDSMKLRSNMLNFKLVADLPLSEQVKAMGEESRYMRILAFCDALIAKKMVEFDPIFAGFLPCRIAVIEDENGQGWLVTMNMDLMLNAVDLPPDLKVLAKKVRDTIYSIVDAGVNGEL